MNRLILSISTIMIFLNLTIYLPLVGLFPFPAYLIDLFIFISITLYYLKKGIEFPYKNPIIWWILYYIILNIGYFIASPAGEEELKFFKVFIFFTFMFFSFIFLFNLDDEYLTTTRKTIIVISFLATFSLGVDYFTPGYFYFNTQVANYVIGRAAATYINSNLAGGAIILLLIFGVGLIYKNLKIFFILLLYIAIFFTMSRSNIIIFNIILIMMLIQKKIYISHFLILSITIALTLGWLSTGGLDTLADEYDLTVTENMKNRINFFTENKSSDTSDMDERLEVLLAALDIYMDNPILGEGYVATRLWKHPVSPHNTLAMNWAEHGIFGIFIIPLFLFFSSRNIFNFGTKEQKELAILVMTYFFLSCFFSHNMLEQPLQIASLLMISTIGYKAKERYQKENR